MEAVSEILLDTGPMAIPRIMVGDQEYCLVNTPDHDMDSKIEIITAISEHDLKNTPGSDEDWLRAIGNHEGEHCNSHKDSSKIIDSIQGEALGDRAAIKMLLERNKHAVATAFKDMRHLSSAENSDIIHSTGLLLNSDAIKPDTQIKIIAAAAPEYWEAVNDEVDDNFNWDAYWDIDGNEAASPEDLLAEDPVAYFSAVNHALDKLEAETLATYKENPSFENASAVLSAQAMINYTKNYEGAYRRQVLKQDVPEHKSVQLLSPEEQAAFYKEAQERIDAENAEVKQDGSPEKTNPAQSFSSNTPIERANDFFSGKTAQVSLEDIRAILPKETTPDMQPEMAAMVEAQSSDAHLQSVINDLKSQGSYEFLAKQLADRQTDMTREAQIEIQQKITPQGVTSPSAVQPPGMTAPSPAAA